MSVDKAMLTGNALQVQTTDYGSIRLSHKVEVLSNVFVTRRAVGFEIEMGCLERGMDLS